VYRQQAAVGETRQYELGDLGPGTCAKGVVALDQGREKTRKLSQKSHWVALIGRVTARRRAACAAGPAAKT